MNDKDDLLVQIIEGQREQSSQIGCLTAEVSAFSRRLERLEERTGSIAEVTGRHELVSTIAEKGAARRGQVTLVIAAAIVGAISTASVAALFAVGASHISWR